MIAQLFIQVHSFNRHLLSALHLAGLTQYREETNRRLKKKKKKEQNTHRRDLGPRGACILVIFVVSMPVSLQVLEETPATLKCWGT